MEGAVRTWPLGVVAAVNALLLALALNPWVRTWSGHALAVLALEAALLVGIGVPAVLFQMLVRKKSLGQSVRDAWEAVMDLLAGAA